jgi:hypothetical protein
MKYQLWTEQEIQLLKELTKSGTHSYKHLTSFFPGRAPNSLQNKARELQIKNPYIMHYYDYNRNYFQVPNFINSMFAGWLAADGCILIRGEYRDLVWGMSQKDIEFLNIFKKETLYNGIIHKFEKINYFANAKQKILKHCDLRYANIGSMAEDLKVNYSVIPQKTLRLGPPNLKSIELKLAYLIGYINGDGSVSIGANQTGFCIKMISSSYKIIEWCRDLIESLSLPSARNYRPSINYAENIFSYALYGVKAIYLLELLKRVPVPVLDRKWNNPKVLEFIEKKKIEHPEWFTLSIDDLILKLGLNFSEPEVPPFLIPQISKITL